MILDSTVPYYHPWHFFLGNFSPPSSPPPPLSPLSLFPASPSRPGPAKGGGVGNPTSPPKSLPGSHFHPCIHTSLKGRLLSPLSLRCPQTLPSLSSGPFRGSAGRHSRSSFSNHSSGSPPGVPGNLPGDPRGRLPALNLDYLSSVFPGTFPGTYGADCLRHDS